MVLLQLSFASFSLVASAEPSNVCPGTNDQGSREEVGVLPNTQLAGTFVNFRIQENYALQINLQMSTCEMLIQFYEYLRKQILICLIKVWIKGLKRPKMD